MNTSYASSGPRAEGHDISFDRHTAGLGPLNNEAFKNMIAFGHKVVSIEQKTPTKFAVHTGCITRVQGHSRCNGIMDFSITKTGVNLTYGNFEHCYECRSQTYYAPERTIEDIESNNSSYQAVIETAKAVVKSIISEEERNLDDARIAGYDEHTPIELGKANRLLNGIKMLESLLDDFHKN